MLPYKWELFGYYHLHFIAPLHIINLMHTYSPNSN